jgi:hypothetical protein
MIYHPQVEKAQKQPQQLQIPLKVTLNQKIPKQHSLHHLKLLLLRLHLHLLLHPQLQSKNPQRYLRLELL